MRAILPVALLVTGCRGILGIESATVAGDGGVEGPIVDAASLIDSRQSHPDGQLVDATLGNIVPVQQAFSDPMAATTVTVKFDDLETVGNVVVVAIGWVGSGVNLESVTDNLGKQYTLANTLGSNGTVKLVMFFSPVVSAGANQVSVTFDHPATTPDLRIAEYANVEPSVNGTSTSMGNSATCSTPTVVTMPGDLLVAANMSTIARVTSVGGGYIERVVSFPDADILADREATQQGGPYNASATMDATDTWIMQLVSFGKPN
jgi:hypothetical protein